MNIDFENNGYLVVRDFFSEEAISILKTYYDLKYRFINSDEKIRSEYHTSDSDIANGLRFEYDFLTESILMIYGKKMSEILELNLAPTYTYTRIYEKGNILYPHNDRPSCEISATCPIFISDDRASTIYISKYKVGEYNLPGYSIVYPYTEYKIPGEYVQVDLMPGDVMFYKGIEHYHWREPLESEQLVQFFMHAVQVDGQYSDYVFDKRPYMGFPNLSYE